MKGNEFLAQVASQPPFSRMHPKIAAFFKEYLSKEKVVDFGGRRVLNTNFPPYPSGAFDNMVEQFNLIGDAAEGRLYSVTMAVTNRCMYNCWHCSNAGRAQKDLALKDWNRLIGRLKEMSEVMVDRKSVV